MGLPETLPLGLGVALLGQRPFHGPFLGTYRSLDRLPREK